MTNITHIFKIAAVAGALALAPLAFAQNAYPTPEAAADALVDGIARHDGDAIKAVVGPDYRKYIPAAASIRRTSPTSSRRGRRRTRSCRAGADKAFLGAGKNGWTLPIPIVKTAAGWRFDTAGAPEEMRMRRIGRNELAAIQVALAYTDAQNEYHARDWNGDGVLRVRDARVVVAGQARRPVLGVAARRAGEPARRGVRRRQGGTAVPRVPVQDPHRAGQGRAGRRPQLRQERADDRGLCADRLAGEVRRHRRDDVHREPGRRRVSRRTSAPSTGAAARALSAYNPDASWSKAARSEVDRVCGAASDTQRRTRDPRRDRTARPFVGSGRHHRVPGPPASSSRPAARDLFPDERPRRLRRRAGVARGRILAGRQRAAAALVPAAAPRAGERLGRRSSRRVPGAGDVAADRGLGRDRRSTARTPTPGEPLLQHYGVHVRCLLAIPLLILAEAALHGAARPLVAQFVSSGIVGPDQRAGFDQAIRDVRRLRDSSLPWVFVLGAAICVVARRPSGAAGRRVVVGDRRRRHAGLRRLVVRLRRAADLPRAGAGLALADAARRLLVLAGRPARPVARPDAPRPHRRPRVRRESARRVRDGDLRAVRGHRVALGARGRLSRRGAALVHAARDRLRDPVDAVRAAAAAGAGPGAGRRARPRDSRLLGAGRRAGTARPPALDPARDRSATRRSSTRRKSARSRTPRACTTRSSACAWRRSARARSSGFSSRSRCR